MIPLRHLEAARHGLHAVVDEDVRHADVVARAEEREVETLAVALFFRAVKHSDAVEDKVATGNKVGFGVRRFSEERGGEVVGELVTLHDLHGLTADVAVNHVRDLDSRAGPASAD